MSTSTTETKRNDAFYFETNPPNKAPIVEVFHQGRIVDYKQLEGKTFQQVVETGYKFYIFGEPLDIKPRDGRSDSPLEYETEWAGTGRFISSREQAVTGIKSLADLSLVAIRGEL